MRVVVVFHLFQRPGPSPEERELGWSSVLEPLLGAIHHTRGVKVGLVLSGDTLQDMAEHHPEGVRWLKELIDEGRVEMIATAHQEPVISAVPLRDGTGQIVAHASMVNRMFGVRPRGGWLPLGVWDPSLPRVMAKGGIEWTLVDERQLLELGITEVGGIYRTERDGYPLALLPARGRSVSTLMNAPVSAVLQRLKRMAVEGQTLTTMCFEAARPGRVGGLDGRSDQAWYATLLRSITGTRQVTSVLPSSVLSGAPLGQVYLPSWAPEDVGVPWERHLVRYEEANRLHKKMQRVSRCVRDLDRAVTHEAHSSHRPDPALLSQARRYLYRAQHAGVYWHGEHAGIYDAVVRYHAWRNLIRAEGIALKALKRDQRMAVECGDYNCDGVDEVVLRTPKVSLTVDPVQGAGVTELSYFEAAFNLTDVMTRREEHYPSHEHVGDLGEEDDFTDDVTDSGLGSRARIGRGLFTDARPRASFVERFLAPSVTLSHVRRGNYMELTTDHCDRSWELLDAERMGDEAVSAQFGCDVLLPGAGGPQPLRLDKRFVLQRDGRLDVRVEVVNRSHDVVRTRLAVEVNLSFPPDTDVPVMHVEGRPIPLNSHGEVQHIDQFQLMSESLTVGVALGPKCRVWHYPIETIYRDQGRRLVRDQGHCVLALWPVELWAKEKARFRISLMATMDDLPTR